MRGRQRVNTYFMIDGMGTDENGQPCPIAGKVNRLFVSEDAAIRFLSQSLKVEEKQIHIIDENQYLLADKENESDVSPY